MKYAFPGSARVRESSYLPIGSIDAWRSQGTGYDIWY